MEIVTAIVTPVVESLMVPVKKHLGYLISCTKYVRDMGTKMHQLEAKRDDVENHMTYNKSNSLEVPTEVRGWLEQVVKIDAQVKSIPSDVGGCFNLKHRHKLGRKAFKIIEEIDRAIEESSTINWSDRPIPLGKVDSMKPSTSTPSTHHNDFKSREMTFMEALKALQPDNKSQMIALCGMGGVGKTTMMEELKKVVAEKKIFDFIVEASIGEKTDPIVIQQSVADFLTVDLKESSKAARAIKLQKSFETRSDGGKKKILVILDDVWELVDLKDIGLSPLPNQGVGFKFLLTSRDKSVCTMMGVEVNSIFKVDVIEDPEAQNIFQGFVQLSSDDHELYKIGEGIVRKCCGLPIAIKTIARTLKGKSNDAWKDALSRLEHHDINEVVLKVFEISYNNLQDEETKSFFLLCGLFSEDFDIPIEDLVRYGWGLELFNNVYSIAGARIRLSTCIERLIHANLLIQSRDVGCIKMHDLVREFVLDMCSKGEHMTIVSNMSNWHAKTKSDSCKRISLTCTNMFELPRNFKFPNLSLLKLMHGDEFLKFPENFYEDMKQLQVIAYDKMRYPLLFRSFECSTNLRTLCLHGCLLMFDWSSISDLLNLEVLSVAHCRIKELPSIIGKLEKLRILDLTGCDAGLEIDKGVLKNLVELEELYMRTYKASGGFKRGIRFPHAVSDELVERSKNLTSLEIELSYKSDLPKNLSFKKLERFKISLGCTLEENDGQDIHSFINTLMLVTNKRELLDSRMDELYEKTEVLHLQVDGMNDIGEILVESSHHRRGSSFYNLRVLHICECANLRYLFTVDVANGLKKLEHLTISNCPVLETLVDCENSGVMAIKFQALKFLSLSKLPKLMSLCNVVNAIELLPLEELILNCLPNFTSIYAAGDISAMQPLLNKEYSQVDVVPWWLCQYFRHIEIVSCDALSTVIPSYAVGHMQKLEYLSIWNCDSVVEVFETQGGSCSTNIDEGSGGTNTTLAIPRLKCIDVPQLSNLKTLDINACERLEHVFTFSALESLMQLQELRISNCKEMKVIVKEEHGDQATMTSTKVVVFPRLKSITLFGLPNLTGFFLWKNEFRWPLLDDVTVMDCPQMMVFTSGLSISPKLNYIHTSLGKFSLECGLNNLNFQNPSSCLDSTSSCLDTLEGFNWRFHDLIEMDVKWNDDVKKIIPSNELLQLQKLEKIDVYNCSGVEEVFEALEGTDSSELQSVNVVEIPKLREVELSILKNLKYIWKNNPWMVLEFPNLTKLSIDECDSLEHVFTSSMVGSLLQLQELHITSCEKIEVIVKEGNDVVEEDECDGKVNEIIMLPRLKSLTLQSLPSLEGFCLGKDAFSWPLLDTLTIYACPTIRVFTKGESTTPELKVIETYYRTCYLREDLNSFIKTKHEKELELREDKDDDEDDDDDDDDDDEDEDEDEDDV